VVSVDYRLCDEPPELGGQPARQIPGTAAEDRAPIPLNDVCAAVAWVREDAQELGADGTRLAIGAASACGRLAAAASRRVAGGERTRSASLPLYLVAHPLNPEPTEEEAEALASTPGPLRFSPQTMRAMSANYFGRPLEEATPYDC